jgi:hypothetical protein
VARRIGLEVVFFGCNLFTPSLPRGVDVVNDCGQYNFTDARKNESTSCAKIWA